MNPFDHTFWFLNPTAWPGLQSAFEQRAPGDPAQPLARRPTTDYLGNPVEQMRVVENKRGKVAVVPVKGALLKNASPSDKRLGATGYEDIFDDMRSAVDQGVRGIVLHIGSPGGMAVGAGDLAEKVQDIAGRVPVYSFTDSMQCSAAEYLSAGCNARFATSDALVGSIGTIMATMSFEQLLKRNGIEARVFASGEHKGAGHPFKDLTDKQAAFLQGFVNTLADEFKGYMQANRPKLQEESMQGQIFTGRQGAKNGLLDATASSLDEVISYL